MRQELAIFAGKRVLVTGDTGFKGSWLCFWLTELGSEVVGYALPPEGPESLFNLLGLSRLIRHVDGDVRDLSHLQKVFQEFQPEFLFHLAAQSQVLVSYQEPKTTFDTNVAGGVNVLEAIKHTPSLRAVIFVTSDKCYLNKEWVWGYRENDELGGHDPYSASKAAVELVLAAYWKSFFAAEPNLGLASVRAGNILGGGDWAQNRIVPDIIRALIKGVPVTLRNPAATRPWQHVLDPLYGYMLLATRLHASPQEFSGPMNFGPSGEAIRTVRDLTQHIHTYWQGGTIQEEKLQQTSHEAGLLHLNCDKARRILDWAPQWDFDRTVRETTWWYKQVAGGESAPVVTRQQIADYLGAGN